MELPSYFDEFLHDIRPTREMRTTYIEAHRLLREQLRAFEPLKEAQVSDFLHGSYRRWTLVRPCAGNVADVDIIVVTKLLPDEWEPEDVLKVFTLFASAHYPGCFEVQGRSICITADGLTMDIVPTAAPSEAEEGILATIDVDAIGDVEGATPEELEKSSGPNDAARTARWKREPLLIPDREAQCWQETHPIAQIEWSRAKNAESNGQYVNVIKAAKWWRQNALSTLKRPKGYPLERAFAECFPTGEVESVAEGLTETFEEFVRRFRQDRLQGVTPDLPDHGLPGQNVLARIEPDDFATLYDAVEQAAEIAREALDDDHVASSATRWRDLLGDPFPTPPAATKHGVTGGFTPRTAPSSPRPKRFA